MPVCPASFAKQPIGLFAGLNFHIRNEPGFLPLRQIVGDEPFDFPFPFEVCLRRRCEIGLLPLGADRAFADPLYGVKPLLEHILRARLKLVFFPQPQPAGRFAVFVSVIPAQGSDRGSMHLAMEGVDHLPVLNRAFFRRFELLGRGARHDFNVESFVCLVRNQLGASAKLGRNQPSRGQGDHPTRLGAARLQAVQVSLGAVSLRVALDAELRDFLVDGGEHGMFIAIHLFAPLKRRPDDVEGAPSEHAGDGVKVGGIGVAAQARRLERDRPAAAKRVAHPRPMPVAQYSQLLDELADAPRVDAQMGVMGIDLFPNRPVQPHGVDLFRTLAFSNLFLVAAQRRQGAAVKPELFLLVFVFSPPGFRINALGLIPRSQLPQFFDGKSVVGHGAAGQTLLVDGHQFLKYRQIPLGVARRGQ